MVQANWDKSESMDYFKPVELKFLQSLSKETIQLFQQPIGVEFHLVQQQSQLNFIQMGLFKAGNFSMKKKNSFFFNFYFEIFSCIIEWASLRYAGGSSTQGIITMENLPV